jgi:hypothetical protein
MKTAAAKMRHTKSPKFFDNKPLGVPLCLGAFVAIFMADRHCFPPRLK